MAHAENIFETYAASTKTAFDYWISFFPTAPMFGVEWRYGEFVMPETGSVAEPSEAKAQDEDNVVELVANSEPEVVEDTVEPLAQALETPDLFDVRPDRVDALTSIKGVGPGLEKQLHALGIYTFAQLADLNDAQLAWLDENLQTVKGRCIRDDWSGQAKALMA